MTCHPFFNRIKRKIRDERKKSNEHLAWHRGSVSRTGADLYFLLYWHCRLCRDHCRLCVDLAGGRGLPSGDRGRYGRRIASSHGSAGQSAACGGDSDGDRNSGRRIHRDTYLCRNAAEAEAEPSICDRARRTGTGDEGVESTPEAAGLCGRVCERKSGYGIFSVGRSGRRRGYHRGRSDAGVSDRSRSRCKASAHGRPLDDDVGESEVLQ